MGNWINAYAVKLDEIKSYWGSATNDDVFEKGDIILQLTKQDSYSSYLLGLNEEKKLEENYVGNEKRNALFLFLQAEKKIENYFSQYGYIYIALANIKGKILSKEPVDFQFLFDIEKLFKTHNLRPDVNMTTARYNSHYIPFSKPSTQDMWPLIGYLTNEECVSILEKIKILETNTKYESMFKEWLQECITTDTDLFFTYY